MQHTRRTLLLTGATGFVGRAAYHTLRAAGWHVRAGTRDVAAARARQPRRDWVTFDAGDEDATARALDGCDAALFLVHGMASAKGDYRKAELTQADTFARVAARAGVRRIVYLGAVAAAQESSEHLQSRLEVGRVLRDQHASTIELRASMIVGHGSLSWLIVRDLAARLPVMVLPRWLKSRSQPVAIDDVVTALVRGLDVELPRGEWFDVPGPDVLTGREILERTAAVLGKRTPLMIEVPLLSPRLSSHWVRFVTRANWSVAREVVLGLKHDLLAQDDRFWHLIDHRRLRSFDEAAKAAIEEERRS